SLRNTQSAKGGQNTILRRTDIWAAAEKVGGNPSGGQRRQTQGLRVGRVHHVMGSLGRDVQQDRQFLDGFLVTDFQRRHRGSRRLSLRLGPVLVRDGQGSGQHHPLRIDLRLLLSIL